MSSRFSKSRTFNGRTFRHPRAFRVSPLSAQDIATLIVSEEFQQTIGGQVDITPFAVNNYALIAPIINASFGGVDFDPDLPPVGDIYFEVTSVLATSFPDVTAATELPTVLPDEDTDNLILVQDILNF